MKRGLSLCISVSLSLSLSPSSLLVMVFFIRERERTEISHSVNIFHILSLKFGFLFIHLRFIRNKVKRERIIILAKEGNKVTL
jgi:hypothetical protein